MEDFLEVLSDLEEVLDEYLNSNDYDDCEEPISAELNYIAHNFAIDMLKAKSSEVRRMLDEFIDFANKNKLECSELDEFLVGAFMEAHDIKNSANNY